MRARQGGATPLQLARDQGRKEVVTLIERHIAGLGREHFVSDVETP